LEKSSERLARLRAKWAPQEEVPPPAPEPVPEEIEPAKPEFKWLQMRITEEKERQAREAMILERLPRASAEVYENLSTCIEAYQAAFGAGKIEMENLPDRIRILVRHGQDGVEEQRHIEIVGMPAIPGFQIDRAGSPMVIEVGMLPDDKLFYRDREQDQYLSMEELTRRILDRALFPKLGE